MENALKKFITEIISQQNFEKINSSNGVVLQRVGGLSPVKQRGNAEAPEKRGVYCFIYPYFDKWQLSSTSHRGIAEPDEHTRGDEFKTTGLRKFVHSGKLYTMLNVPGSIKHASGWYQTDGISLKKYLTKFHAILKGEMLKSQKERGGNVNTLTKSSPEKYFSVDHFVVFVPNPEGGRV